ncbi:MAG: hypothetical protein JST21_00210 [Bacteroidetes bacterium]|nr:hypothetical protein [Bacteroidota bacterium]
MRKLITGIFFMFIAAAAPAQKMAMGSDYTTAIGIKFYPGSITAKTFIREKHAIEGLLSVWNYGTRITGLYEFYGDINGVEGLKYYYGPGVHLGFWNHDWRDKFPTRDGGAQFGFDGVVGLDYKIKNAPINVSLDWQPSFTFVGYNYFEGGWGGIGLRYAF